MPKLTLNVDSSIVEQAKNYAKQHETSVSELVELYLAALVSPPATTATPLLRQLRGMLRDGDRNEYREHLSKKYL